MKNSALKSQILAAGAALALLTASPAPAQVDWTARIVKAKGIGAPNPKQPEAAARPGAIRAAKMLSLRNALELVKGIPLNSQTVIKEAMVENDMVNTSINGFVQGFEFEPSPHYMSDGTVEIEVTIPLDGIGGLGNAIFGGGTNLVGEKPSATFSGSGKGTAFSGLIVDCKGLGVKPALMPKIVDEKDKEIYGSAYVSRDFAIKFGMCGYAKSIENAKALKDRIGAAPGVVKGLKAAGPNKADIVISNADAASVQGAADNMKFLSECRVIVVVD